MELTASRGSIGRTWTLGDEMQCPYCAINFHDNWIPDSLIRNGKSAGWTSRTAVCSGCQKLIWQIGKNHEGGQPREWRQVVPVGTHRGPIPKEVPNAIAVDYAEATDVLPLSAKASAALSRRCLQAILREQGYKARDLAAEIDLLLNEPDPAKGIPTSLRDTVDAIRNFGNFSAHPITDVTQLQVIDVEPHEAEWCLEIIEELFQHFYVRPAEAAARKAALNAKLAAAGKPPAK